ncbi:MAG: hypothetical protein WEF50_13890 [Myxococcota bacterium]
MHERSRRALLAICVAFVPALDGRAEPADPWAIPRKGAAQRAY